MTHLDREIDGYGKATLVKDTIGYSILKIIFKSWISGFLNLPVDKII